MGRRSSTREDYANLTVSDDEDETLHHSRRKKQKVNYAAIENNYDDLDAELETEGRLNDEDDDNEPGDKPVDGSHASEEPKYEDDEEYQEESFRPTRRSQSRSTRIIRNDDDDESFNEDGSDQEDDGSEFDEESDITGNRSIKNFISKDDDDDDEDHAYGASRRVRRKRRRGNRSESRRSSRKTRTRQFSSSSDEGQDTNINDQTIDDIDSESVSLRQELAELAESSPPPPPRSLRQRKKAVNYAIPPPLPENFGADAVIAPSTPRRRGGVPSGPIRRLFPTGGPFGGGDVTSIFGKNFSALNGGLLAGGADSDSSEDEILAIGASSKRKSTALTPNKKKKQIADSDPLGVDMNIDFSAIGGLNNYISQLKEMVALPLLYPEVYQKFGITPPRGVLFHGPPGTGKTLMARALAASCSTQGKKITFFMRKGADCLSKWVGEAERQLRLLFEEAKKQQPSIIFFDEIDGLAPVRSSKQEQIHASIVSTLLALMDGMDNRGQVIVIGATNRPDAVDPALRRPGRFDREFYFPLPDIKAREEILKINTKKWSPALNDDFIQKLAGLTKGYGGADIRALCTEAALNSIQREYPQIYSSNDKLQIDTSKIHVAARDFMKALDKIIPSSARSVSNGSAPLPTHLRALLSKQLEVITTKLNRLVPTVKKLSTLEDAMYIDPTENDKDGGFAKHELLKRLESTRVCRPRLLLSGLPGNGQQYLGAAILNHLEGFNVQSLDLGSIYGDATRSTETAIIQSFIEARHRQPSIIYIPNIEIWYNILPESAKFTLAGLLRSLGANEKIMLLGLSETPSQDLDHGLRHLFGLLDENYFELETPDESQRIKFFEPLSIALHMKPNEFLDSRKKRKLKTLKKVDITPEEAKTDLKSFEKSDMKLKNTIKIKLAGLMDLFKIRYKRFKKPPIDDALLIHLFEQADPDIPQAYSKDGDMIVENSTNRRFYNMDLDIVEERLWNGFYCEPKQFLRDIELIYLDSVTLNDRERLIKASEMYANAQVGVEEISTPEFLEQCKLLKAREAARVLQYEEQIAKLRTVKSLADVPETEINGHGVVVNENLSQEHSKMAAENGIQTDSISENMNAEVVNTSASLNSETQDICGNNLPSENGDVKVTEDITKINTLPVNMEIDEVSKSQNINTEQLVATVPKASSLNQLLTTDKIIESSRPQQFLERSQVEPDVEPQSESEGGQDDSIEELKSPFELDDSKLDGVLEYLVKETEGFVVESLEQVNARLMEIVWNDRQSWNRNDTLAKVSDEIEKIKEVF